MIETLYLVPAHEPFLNAINDLLFAYTRKYVEMSVTKSNYSHENIMISIDYIIATQYRIPDYEYIATLMNEQYPNVDLIPVGIFYIEEKSREYLAWSTKSGSVLLNTNWIDNYRYLSREYIARTFDRVEYA